MPKFQNSDDASQAAGLGPQDIAIEPRGTQGTEMAVSGHLIDAKASDQNLVAFTIPCQGKMFDVVDNSFTQYFEYLELDKIKSIELSGNSYGMDACKWIAENVLTHCINLQAVNFSDIFTTRERK